MLPVCTGTAAQVSGGQAFTLDGAPTLSLREMGTLIPKWVQAQCLTAPRSQQAIPPQELLLHLSRGHRTVWPGQATGEGAAGLSVPETCCPGRGTAIRGEHAEAAQDEAAYSGTLLKGGSCSGH